MSLAMLNAFKQVKSGLSPTQRFVAWALADCHNEFTGRCDPSIAYITETTGFSNRTVCTALDALEKSGHLTSVGVNGQRKTYRLHPKTSEPASPLTSEPASQVQQSNDVKPVNLLPEPVNLLRPTSEPVAETSEGGSHEPLEPEGVTIEPLRSEQVAAGEFSFIAEIPKPAPEPTPRGKRKPATNGHAADPRHYAITSQIKEVHFKVTKRHMVYQDRFHAALSRFLKGWDGTADDFLDAFADALYFTEIRPFNKFVGSACNPCNLCLRWNETCGEIERFRREEAQPAKVKPSFSKTA